MTETLPEVAVTDADPETRAIYERIMAATGVGSPALIYRHFAVFPGFLDWVWALIGPDLESGHVAAHALAARDAVTPVKLSGVDAATFDAAAVDDDARAEVRGIFATYNRMNPINLSLISAIRDLVAGAPAMDDAPLLPDRPPLPPPDAPARLPAPLGLDAMRADVRDAVLGLSDAIPSPGATVIPTLYRHLAIWPELMIRLAPSLRAAMDAGTVLARMDELSTAMSPLVAHVANDARARDIGPPPLTDRAAMARTLNSFLFTIPQLIVVGRALEAALFADGTEPRGNG